MLLRARKSRMAGRTLAAALACACIMMSGCAEGGSTNALETNQADGTGEVSVSDSAQGDATTVESSDDSSAQTVEKTEFELAMEISDENERLKALFELIKKDPNNNDALQAFIDATVIKSRTNEVKKIKSLKLTDEFKKTQKEEHLEKLKEMNCKYVQFRYGSGSFGEPNKSLEEYSALYYQDDNNRVIYTPYMFNYYMRSQATVSDVTFHYDEAGRWISTDVNSGDERSTDKAIYDDQGRLTKVYLFDDFLAYEYKYDKNGYVVKEKNNWWDIVYEYAYNDEGYVNKITKTEAGVKSEERIPGIIRVEYNPDDPGFWDLLSYYNPNFVVKKNTYNAYTGERMNSDNYDFLDPRDYQSGNELIDDKDNGNYEILTIAKTRDYGDGFLEITVYELSSKLVSRPLSYSLFYLPE